MNATARPEPNQPENVGTTSASPRILTSAEILQGEKRVIITHGDEVYRLLVTRNDKLILQK